MKKDDRLTPGEVFTRDGGTLRMEDGVLDITELEQYDREYLKELREELYTYAKEGPWPTDTYTTGIVMINAELQTRKSESNK